MTMAKNMNIILKEIAPITWAYSIDYFTLFQLHIQSNWEKKKKNYGSMFKQVTTTSKAIYKLKNN